MWLNASYFTASKMPVLTQHLKLFSSCMEVHYQNILCHFMNPLLFSGICLMCRMQGLMQDVQNMLEITDEDIFSKWGQRDGICVKYGEK